MECEVTDFIRIIRPSFVLLSLNVGMGRVVTIPENPSKPSKSDLENDFFLYSMCVIYRDTCWKRLRFKGLLEFLYKKPVYKKKKFVDYLKN